VPIYGFASFVVEHVVRQLPEELVELAGVRLVSGRMIPSDTLRYRIHKDNWFERALSPSANAPGTSPANSRSIWKTNGAGMSRY
jgi:hypothetical protein